RRRHYDSTQPETMDEVREGFAHLAVAAVPSPSRLLEKCGGRGGTLTSATPASFSRHTHNPNLFFHLPGRNCAHSSIAKRRLIPPNYAGSLVLTGVPAGRFGNYCRYTCAGNFPLQRSAAMNWSEQIVLVTGGTGSFGRKFIELMLREYRP